MQSPTMAGNYSLLVLFCWQISLITVGSLVERNNLFRGDENPPVAKRQRVLPLNQESQNHSEDVSERSPLLASRSPQIKSRTPTRTGKYAAIKPQAAWDEGMSCQLHKVENNRLSRLVSFRSAIL